MTEVIRYCAASRKSDDPDLELALIKLLLGNILSESGIYLVGGGLEACGVARIFIAEHMGVADPLAAVAVAADDDGQELLIRPRQLLHRKGVGTAVVYGLCFVKLAAFYAALVKAHPYKRLANVFVALVSYRKGGHGEAEAQYAELVVIAAGGI